MRAQVKELWGLGGVGVILGTAVALVADLADVDRVHMGFYTAIAAAIPILLLAVVVRIHAQAEMWWGVEGRRERISRELEDQQAALQESVGRGESLLARAEAAGAESELAVEARAGLDAAREALGTTERGQANLPGPVGVDDAARVVMWTAFGAAFVGEVSSLYALAAGRSDFAVFLLAALALLVLFIALVGLESAAITTRLRLGGAAAEG